MPSPFHSASTNRGLTLAQLRYHREVLNPLSLTILEARLAALSRYAAAGAEQDGEGGAEPVHRYFPAFTIRNTSGAV